MRQLADKIAVRSSIDSKHAYKEMKAEDKGMGVAKLTDSRLASIARKRPEATSSEPAQMAEPGNGKFL